MAILSLLEKLAILFEVSRSSIFFIISIIFIVFFGLVLITTNKINIKNSRKLFISLYIFIIAFTFILYRESLSSMIEYLMNNLFVVIYFPNLAVYFAAIVITNLILWFSVFNYKASTIIRNVNIIVYLLMSYLLIVLLSVINTEKLDVFNQSSIYGNQTAQAIIELSSVLFILWIIFLIVYKGIMTYLTRNNDYSEEPKMIVSNIDKKLTKTDKKSDPYIVKSTPTFAKNIRKDEDLIAYENILTIEDYKLLLDLLKEKKESDKEQTQKAKEDEKAFAKYQELKDLYGVR